MNPENNKNQLKLTKRGKNVLKGMIGATVLAGGLTLGVNNSAENPSTPESITYTVEQDDTLTDIVVDVSDELNIEPDEFRDAKYDTLHDPVNVKVFGSDDPSSSNLQPGDKIVIKAP